MKAIIIEDEIIAAQSLQALIEEIDSSIEINAVLQSIDESLEWFQLHGMPDLVFMDIHLADGSSFSIFEQIKITCPVIFTTAYDEYALKAFEVNSIDYLLKPINKSDLERAIDKYKNLTSNNIIRPAAIEKLINEIKQKSTYKSYFLVFEKDKLIPLAIKDIAYIYVDTKLIKAVTLNEVSYYMEQTLDDIMKQLDPHLFFRANRQFIISKEAIKDISIWFGHKLSINMKSPTPERIVVSKARVKEFKNWFTD